MKNTKQKSELVYSHFVCKFFRDLLANDTFKVPINTYAFCWVSGVVENMPTF